MVDRRRWMDAHEFEDANAACGLLPGPASTQLAIFCAYRVGGPLGAVVGGLGFILPAVILVLALSVLFFGQAPPSWVRGAGAGAGAAVAAVAVDAGLSLLRPSFERVRSDARPAGALDRLPRGRGRGRRADRPLPRARAARLRAARARAAAPAGGRAERALGAARGRSSRRPSRPAGSARCAGRRSRSAPSPTAAAS